MERVPAVRNCPAIARDEGDQSYFWGTSLENYAALKIAFSHGILNQQESSPGGLHGRRRTGVSWKLNLGGCPDGFRRVHHKTPRHLPGSG
jgi:hypothetical protein